MQDENPLITEIKALREKEKELQGKIKNEFKESVVVFVDMVDSTQFKFANDTKPEVWIHRLFEFTYIVSKYIKNCNGTVIKYIGDEVMGEFRGSEQIKNSIDFLNQIDNLVEEISLTVGVKVEIKVSVDKGKVFPFDYGQNAERDPQGIPVDRCSRIGKLCAPGTVLTSEAYFLATKDRIRWNELAPNVEFKGIGEIKVFQLDNGTSIINLARSENNVDRLKAAGKVCDLVEMVNVKEHAPSVSRQWAYDRKCLVHDFHILGQYSISIDVYLDRSPIKIQLFGRNNSSIKYLKEIMCNDPLFVEHKPFVYWENGIYFASFDNANDIEAIAYKLIALLRLIEKYNLKEAKPK